MKEMTHQYTDAELTDEQLEAQITEFMKIYNPLVSTGMTLMDHFAGLAMLGMHNECYDLSQEERAKYAYEQAGAMLRARHVKR